MFAGKQRINDIEIYLEYCNLRDVKGHSEDLEPKEIPYVIMHGHSANRHFVKPIYEMIKEQGYPVLMFDLRGHGWSEKSLSGKYTLEESVEDLFQIYSKILKEQFGYSKFYLSGHSMGGFIAMKYALKYRETLEKLVLLSTSPKIADGFLWTLGLKVMLRGFKKNYDKWFNMKKKGHEKIGMEYFPQWEDTTLMPDPNAVIEFMEDMLRYNIEDELSNIKLPTFVCMARKDGTMTMNMFKKLVERIPNVQSHLYEEFQHNITIEAKDLPKRIANFLYN